MTRLGNGSPLSVSAYPTAWRVKVVDDAIHRGFEYFRSEHVEIRRLERSLTLHVSFIGGPRR